MENLLVLLVSVLAVIFILGTTIVGSVVILNSFKRSLNEAKLLKEDGVIPIDNERLCTKPHKWEPLGIVSPEEALEAQSQEDLFSKAKSALACTECGLISGATSQMLGAGAVGRLRFQQEKRKIVEKVRKLVDEKKAKVISKFSEKTGVDSKAIELLVEDLSSIPYEVEQEFHAEKMREVLEGLK